MDQDTDGLHAPACSDTELMDETNLLAYVHDFLKQMLHSDRIKQTG